ncbi:DEAD/DEAH box helicase family protein [Uliginosibacterium sp. 31-16]|uniref:DEAD/DEAH box helicase family protein n=1 Tax=Uliginosibacterium sp. 31-16 TaxID=3068315 RepID=UPI00273D16A1|nr:DEAD/DEAH box helicase family protein [Uliginosibacterium sp. 31-16]MDP5239122.1 DEAD/DEAH box helicase family protein [Uliginosibacterium sp. 31-16]
MANGQQEAFSRVKIDQQLKDVGWKLDDGQSVRYEYTLPDGTRADYVLCDRHGRSLAVIEAKKAAINPADAAMQGRGYAEQLNVPFVFLSNGEEIRFWDWRNEAHPHPVSTFFKQDDLERRVATRQLQRDPLTVEIDKTIVERDYQLECIDTLCKEIKQGRRKLLVEMATGTGKTRTAAAFIKRLFDANLVTRVLFLVDRIPLALQTEDAFAEHLRDYPCYTLRSGRRFEDQKRITITTLQSMINLYHEYSSGYFDLIITDECHRSIYGKWSGVLKHFDGITVGLTATPCVANVEESGDAEDGAFVRDTLKFFEVDKPTFSYKMHQAIADGHLVPYQIYKAKTVKTAAEGGFPVKKSEIDWSAVDGETRRLLEAAFGDKDEMIVEPAALERKFTIPERNRAIVREYRQVLEGGFIDHRGIKREPLMGKTIVFAVTKRHAETLARMFDEAFADKKPSPDIRYADYVVSDLGNGEDTPDAATIIKRFKKETYPQILVSVNMLDTGFDCPDVVNLIFARFTASQILYQQMRGRGTRKAKNKPVFTLFDFVGVTDHHRDELEYANGGVMQPKAKPYKSQPRKLLMLDITDHIDPTSRAWVTIDEAGNMVQLDDAEAKRQLLGARFESWLLENTFNSDQLRLLLQLGEQIKASPDQFREIKPQHFAVIPAFKNNGGLPRWVQIFGGAEALNQLLAALNATVFKDIDDNNKPLSARL